jgi:hypothetical protein
MSPILFVFLVLLLTSKKGAPIPAGGAPAATATSDAAAQAAAEAAAAAAKAAATKSAEDAAAAAAAANKATVLTQAASTQAKTAAKAPAPFPQARPSSGLPPFPGPGWKPAIPTPPAVVTRAQQLLPVLWRSGSPGASTVELTAGEHITYLAQFMNPAKTIKGVTAWRLRSPAGTFA